MTADVPPIRPERVAVELDAALADRRALVAADASYSTIWMGNYLRARRPGQRFLSLGVWPAWAGDVPLALGARAAHPDAATVALVGDGGFGHVWSELETAVREQLPVVVVLLDNGILGFQKHVELVQFGEHTTATDFSPVDHAAVARACGAEAARIESPAELGAGAGQGPRQRPHLAARGPLRARRPPAHHRLGRLTAFPTRKVGLAHARHGRNPVPRGSCRRGLAPCGSRRHAFPPGQPHPELGPTGRSRDGDRNVTADLAQLGSLPLDAVLDLSAYNRAQTELLLDALPSVPRWCTPRP